MRYGIDVDGVLSNFDKGFAKAIRLAPEPLSYTVMAQVEKPAKNWDHKKDLVGEVNWKWFWRKGAYDLRVFEQLPPYNGELESLTQLPGEVFLITLLPVGLRPQRFTWLAKHHVSVDGVLFTNLPEEKLEYLNDLHIDHFVDDRIETHAALVGKTEARLYVMDRPWNRGKFDFRIQRIKHLKELL